MARLLNPPLLALLFWIFFARMGYGPSSAQDRVGLLQQTTAMPFVGEFALTTLSSIADSVPSNRDAFLPLYLPTREAAVPSCKSSSASSTLEVT